jgi:hypothetical protein
MKPKRANGAAKRGPPSKQQSNASKAPPRTDAAIIRAAVTYAQCVAAHHGGFQTDPSGDNDTAASTGRPYFKKAKRQLELLANLSARSIEAVDAKARCVPILLMDGADRATEIHELAFLSSFANDVRSFLGTLTRALAEAAPSGAAP